MISDQSSSVKSAVALCLLVVLLFATWLYWQCSYTASPLSTFTLQPSTLDFPATFTATAASKPVANITFTIPKYAEGAHISYSAKAIDILPGDLPWLRGRALFLRDTPFKDKEYQLFALEDNNSAQGEFILLAPTRVPPVIRIENTATRGTLVVERLQITQIQSRWWRLPAGILLWIAWIAWAKALIHTISHQSPLRSLAAAILFIIALYAVARDWTFPIKYPIFAPFLVGTPEAIAINNPPNQCPVLPTESKKDTVSTQHPGPSPFVLHPSSFPQIPTGTLFSAFHTASAQARPIVHLLPFIALSFTLALLVCWKVAGTLSAFTALASEISQIIFGQPGTLNDMADIADLALDTCGILIGLLLAETLIRMFTRRHTPPFDHG